MITSPLGIIYPSSDQDPFDELVLGAAFAKADALLQAHQSPAPATVGQIIKGAAAQSADLQQWQNSAATVLAAISASGQIAAAALALAAGGQIVFAGDTNLYRLSAGVLKTDSALNVAGSATIGGSASVGVGLTVALGQAYQVDVGYTGGGLPGLTFHLGSMLYENAGLELKTNARFTTAYDPGAGAPDSTGFLLYHRTTGTIKQVVLGAVDSGGPGYRLLRVIN